MENTMHTPGPWATGHETGPDDPDTTFRGPFVDVVANLGFCQVALAAGDSTAEAQANARLIASAPDLLEALMGLLPMWESGIREPWVEAARAAIAKATGRE